MIVNLDLKNEIYQFALSKVGAQLEELLSKLKSLEEDKNSETKSVVGDKYETSRSMLQKEVDQINERIGILQNHRTQLMHIKRNEQNHKLVGAGSLVGTDLGIFYISIPLGKLEIGDVKVFCMSIDAPLAKSLRGKSIGESIQFNNRTYTFTSLC